jgi:hypothetical protein
MRVSAPKPKPPEQKVGPAAKPEKPPEPVKPIKPPENQDPDFNPNDALDRISYFEGVRAARDINLNRLVL